ncbi:MAG: hypothetical protein DA328_02900 [Nitrososphaeraceae archaeon]|nr:hypothetical protein [Nitrososphaeraceae archaeon]
MLVSNDNQGLLSSNKKVVYLSIIIPTYNESENIEKLLDKIILNVPNNCYSEIIVVDDDSPDGTSKIVTDYIKHDEKKTNPSINKTYHIKLVNKKNKNGLIAAIVEGVKYCSGENILVMDADFSHPPEIIPKMIEEIQTNPNAIVIASRYVKNGFIIGWPFKRRLLSKGAAKIARIGLQIHKVTDPMSGFFLCPRRIFEEIRFDTKGYKLLLEILVKANNVNIREVPYTFTDRKSGKSKMGMNVIFDYITSVWQLYRISRKSK